MTAGSVLEKLGNVPTYMIFLPIYKVSYLLPVHAIQGGY